MTSEKEYKVWFFAGGEARDDSFNVFTGSFIGMMKNIFGNDFDFIRGINYKSTARNVMWALNNAQKPVRNSENEKIFSAACKQIQGGDISAETQIILVSSSTGSVAAAQAACFMAKNHSAIFNKPFHLVLGASMISPLSDLYKQLVNYQDEGIIGIILHDEIQDDGDNTTGVGGTSRSEAYKNAFGIMFPFLSLKFNKPSFLNADPQTGHIHRKRSKSIQKAIDYIKIIFIQHRLAGDYYMKKSIEEIGRVEIK